MIPSNTQTIIQLNDKMKLAQVQPEVRSVGFPHAATQPHLFPYTLGLQASNAFRHIKKQDWTDSGEGLESWEMLAHCHSLPVHYSFQAVPSLAS